MTSLRGSLPPAGSTLWQKERRSSSVESSPTSTSLITHIVIREVWQKTIPSPHALYKIDVMTKSNHWYILKRYREFSRLHRMLVIAYGIPKDMLPPKKLTSKLSLKHLERRRDALEHYLQRLVNSSTYVSSSPEVLDFLDVNNHDVTAVTKSLAKDILHIGDVILAEGGCYTFTLTQLYCITRQLQLPEPINVNEDHSPLDLGHLYSFVYQLEELCVVPNRSTKGCQELTGHLEFDVALFKALRSLKIDECPVYLIKGLAVLQAQLKYLAVRHSLKTMGELLVDRVVGRRKESASSSGAVATWRNQATARLTKNRVILQPWVQLMNLTLAYNKISTFDESLKLMPALQSLDLRYNEFVSLDFQQMNCPSLTHLDVSHNCITTISGNSNSLPNLKSLILSHNKLDNLIALGGFTGLIEVDLAWNHVGSLKELRNLSKMSQLRYLSVDGNPLTKVKSYRVQIFSFFCGRKIILDNKPQMSTDEGTGSIWPRSRSFSTPESVTRGDDDEIVRLVRANSDVTPANVDDDVDDDDDDDGDSGIDGFTTFSTNVATSNADQEDLEFNWSYFDFLDVGKPGIFSAGPTSAPLEEQINEDMCEQTVQSTSSTESAYEVVVNNDSSLFEDSSGPQDGVSDVVTLPLPSSMSTLANKDSSLVEDSSGTQDGVSDVLTLSSPSSMSTLANKDSSLVEDSSGPQDGVSDLVTLSSLSSMLTLANKDSSLVEDISRPQDGVSDVVTLLSPSSMSTLAIKDNSLVEDNSGPQDGVSDVVTLSSPLSMSTLASAHSQGHFLGGEVEGEENGKSEVEELKNEMGEKGEIIEVKED